MNKLVTNADRIRSMTDEELSLFFGDTATACLFDDSDICNKYNGSCDMCWLDWLKQEVD